MQKKNENKPVKQILLFIIVLTIVLLILFSKNIVNIINKTKMNLAQNLENKQITNEPNIPQLSAGMIPVKWNGSNWIITTKNDENWYNYNEGKFAYVMLNDGVYQSEPLQNMREKILAKEHIGETIENSQLGTIFAWIPRYAYKESGEMQYVITEVQPGEGWIIPDIFIYGVEDETKPDFSLSGIWIQKDVDMSYSSKIAEMNKEWGEYGFLAKTKPVQITTNNIAEIQKYIVGVGDSNDVLTDISNINRIILKIVNVKKCEPIKANVIHNTIDQKLEIRVTYTKNGIKQILNENGDNMELTENDGVIYTDTSNIGLATGTYTFTVIDNENNKKELSIDIIADLFKVAYIDGTDNMNIDTTYAKTQETITSDESSLLNQIRATDTTKTFSRAISSSGDTTAIAQNERTSDDSPIYIYERYNASYTATYTWKESFNKKDWFWNDTIKRGYTSYSTNSSTGEVYFSGSAGFSSGTRYSDYWSPTKNSSNRTQGTFYKLVYAGRNGSDKSYYNLYTMVCTSTMSYVKGDYVTGVTAADGTYTIGSPSKVHSDGYWYERNSLAPKYTLYKYDENLILKSAYNVDAKVLTTVPINITNKGNNKVKLTLNTSGSDYKTYISNDNTNWQEVTGITSGTPKELDVDGWDNLYIKIETNTSRIDNINVAYYKT